MSKENLIEISDMLTPEAFTKLKRGQMLRFKDGDTFTELRIVRINKRKRTCFAEQITTMTPEEFEEKLAQADKASSQ